MATPPFHLAFPVHDLAQAKDFYGRVLGCELGRETEGWVDINFFGHQLSAHLCADLPQEKITSDVDGVQVPLRHFGAVLDWAEWEKLGERIKNHGVKFVIEPMTRYRGKRGEQATMFLLDPSGNALEFKALKQPEYLFAE